MADALPLLVNLVGLISGKEFVVKVGAKQLEESPAYTLPDCNEQRLRELAGIEPTVRTRDGVITMVFELRDCNAVIVCPRIPHTPLLRGGFLLLLPCARFSDQ